MPPKRKGDMSTVIPEESKAPRAGVAGCSFALFIKNDQLCARPFCCHEIVVLCLQLSHRA